MTPAKKKKTKYTKYWFFKHSQLSIHLFQTNFIVKIYYISNAHSVQTLSWHTESSCLMLFFLSLSWYSITYLMSIEFSWCSSSSTMLMVYVYTQIDWILSDWLLFWVLQQYWKCVFFLVPVFVIVVQAKNTLYAFLFSKNRITIFDEIFFGFTSRK